MRVTPQIQVARTLRNLKQSNARLTKFQDQISSGKRLARPSDDPAAAAIIRRNKSDEALYETYKQTIADSGFVIESQVTALVDTRELLQQVTAIAIEANNSDYPNPHSEVLANEVENLFDRAVALANSRSSDGRYLFSGTSTNTRSFVVSATDSNGKPSRVSYGGSNETTQSIVGRDQTVGTFISGESVFQRRDRAQTVLIGQTGASAGTGTSNSTGQGQLIVSDNGTGYVDPASGLVTAAGPFTLGVGLHSLTISGGGTLISLNGAAPVASGGATLTLTDLAGESFTVDASGTLTDGTYVVSRGQLSTDGGATTANITSSNQTVTNSLTGEFTYINTSGITQTGTDLIDNQGSYDLFQTIIGLRDALRNTNNLSNNDRHTYLARTLTEFERIRESIVEPLGIQAARAEHLQSLTFRTEDLQDELVNQNNALEATDLPTAILGLQAEENSLQGLLAVTARLNQLSLVDFLA